MSLFSSRDCHLGMALRSVALIAERTCSAARDKLTQQIRWLAGLSPYLDCDTCMFQVPDSFCFVPGFPLFFLLNFLDFCHPLERLSVHAHSRAKLPETSMRASDTFTQHEMVLPTIHVAGGDSSVCFNRVSWSKRIAWAYPTECVAFDCAYAMSV